MPRVLVGYDTRESSPQLAAEVRQGVEAMHGFCLCLNLVTTPQLHYAVYHMVRCVWGKWRLACYFPTNSFVVFKRDGHILSHPIVFHGNS